MKFTNILWLIVFLHFTIIGCKQKRTESKIYYTKIDSCIAEKNDISRVFLNLEQQNELKSALKELSELSLKKDWKSIREKRISREFGLCIMYRMGVTNLFAEIENLSDSLYKGFPEAHLWAEWNALESSDVPEFFCFDTVSFDCDEMEWYRHGFFLSNTKEEKFLSQTLDFYEKQGMEIGNAKLYNYLRELDNRSIQLILTNTNQILYFIEVEGKFYLSFIDMATTSCSA